MDFLEFQNKLRMCRYCKDIDHKPLVWGNQEAKIVQISQAPSKSAGERGKPFSKKTGVPDESGKKLIEWYAIDQEIFYDPNIFYITAIAHCYPGKDKSGDKKPPKKCAEKWLMKELSYLNPKLFIVVGKHAADHLFKGKNYNKLIFDDQKFLGRLTVVLPHPSPANKKWFKDNPEFENERLLQIRKHIHRILYGPEGNFRA